MRTYLLRIFVLCRKELLAILKDPRSRVILFAPVLLQSLIFGYAATYDLNHVPYALLDQDRSQASRELAARLDGSGLFERVYNLDAPGQIAAAVDAKRVLAVLHIGPRFERKLLAGETAPVQVIVDGRNSNTGGTAAGYLNGIVEAFNRDWRARHGQAGGAPRIETRAWYNPNLETRWNMIPGLIAGLAMLQTLMLTALSVAREREQGTFDQLLVTPITPGEILLGKALPSVLVGLVQSTVILAVALWWFHIPFSGSFLLLYAGLVVFMFAIVGIGLSVSALSANMQQAMLYAFVLMMPMMLLSGLMTPIGAMPRAVQFATLFNPARYGIDLVQRVYLEGAGLALVAADLWPLCVTSVVTLSAASWLFRNRFE